MLALRQTAKRQVASSYSLPAPIGGLNARDSIAEMPETDAVILDNVFPNTTSVDLRKGRLEFATFTGSCESIIVYSGGVKLFVAVNDGTDFNIFDATGGTALDTAAVGGSGDTIQALSSARFEYQNFGTPGGQFLSLVNGLDTPLQFDGTDWTASSMSGSGLTPANLFTVAVYSERLWYGEKGTFNIWYLDVQSITGTLTKMNIGSLFKLGGYLSNIITFSADSGSLLAEFIAFVSTEGEVVVYSGIDPSSITTWARVAQFRVGKPVVQGNRAWCKIASEAVLITADGAMPMSAAFMQDRANTAGAISDKIRSVFNQDVVSFSAQFGWAAVLHPAGQKLLVNVPTAALSTGYQYVMNTQTKAWCRFTGWDAYCVEATKDTLYWGGDGHLSIGDYGATDNGEPILASAKQAFSYLKARGREKFVTMARPIITLDGPVNLGLSVDVDYQNIEPTSLIPIAGSAGDPWEVAFDVAWTGAPIVYKNWHSIRGIGFAIALRLQFQAKDINLSWAATDLVFMFGAIL